MAGRAAGQAVLLPSGSPKDFPEFYSAKPEETDFQLQQALIPARAMAAAGTTYLPAEVLSISEGVPRHRVEMVR